MYGNFYFIFSFFLVNVNGNSLIFRLVLYALRTCPKISCLVPAAILHGLLDVCRVVTFLHVVLMNGSVRKERTQNKALFIITCRHKAENIRTYRRQIPFAGELRLPVFDVRNPSL